MQLAAVHKQSTWVKLVSDDEVEEDEETESFAALEGEALVITSLMVYSTY